MYPPIEPLRSLLEKEFNMILAGKDGSKKLGSILKILT